MTTSSPHCAIVHSTIFCGGACSNIALISGRSSCAVSVVIILLTAGGQQFVHPLFRHPPAIGEAQVDVLFVRPVEVASTGFQQIIAVGERGVFFDLRRAMIAMDDLDPS